MKHNIVWLASYPKSGNTWFRAVLSVLLEENETLELDINNLYRSPIASNRAIFDEYAGLASSDLTTAEIDVLRPEVYKRLSRDIDEPIYMKVHDAYTLTPEKSWFFPPEVTQSVVYLVRDPLDVAVSFAFHNSQSIDKTIENMCREDFSLSKTQKGLPLQLRQTLLSWSGHVRSWTKSPNQICVLRYEDLKLNGFKTFKRVADFLKLGKDDDEIMAAIDQCSFDNLRKQEEKKYFKEKPAKCKFFFRKGQVGNWREHLSSDHCQKIITNHREVMKEFGYLDDNDKPVFQAKEKI